jgi:dsRNA-specific ribonuclease
MKNKIKELFSQLDKNEQIELLKELSSNSGTAISIAEFSQKHQKKFGKSIEFEIDKTGPDHMPVITATVITSFGSFEGNGSNQKIAKANAIQNADNYWDK